MDSTQNFNIFKNLMLYTFLILLGILIYKVQFILLLFFSAFIIACSIDPLVEAISTKLPRKPAVVLISISGILLISVFLIPLLNILISQTLLSLKKLPEYWQQLLDIISQVHVLGVKGFLDSFGFGKLLIYAQNLGIVPEISQVIDFSSKLGQDILAGSIDSIKNIISSIMFVFLMAMFTLYMLMDKIYLKDKFFSFFPPDKRDATAEIMLIISKKVGGYVISQIIVIIFICLFLSIGLSLLKIEFALVLGFIAALLELIPVVGPFIATIIIFLVALAQKPILGIFAIIIYGLIEWLVDNIVRPAVFSKFLSLHPLTFILSLYIGATLFGIAGMILAPAFAAVTCVLIDELYLKNINKDSLIKP